MRETSVRSNALNVSLAPLPNAPMPGATQPAAGLDFARLLATLRRQLPIILAMPVLCGAIGLALFLTLTPRFLSSVEVLIEPARNVATGPQSEFSGIAVDQMRLGSVTAIITSPTFLRRVVQSESLADDPEFGQRAIGLRARASNLLPFIPPPEPPPEESQELREARALGRLQRAVRALRVGFTYVLRIDVTTADPARSQRIARALGDAYLLDQLENKFEDARRAASWMADRIGGLRVDLIASEQEVERIRRQYGLQELERGGNTINRTALADLNTQLQAARAELLTRQNRLEQLARAQRSGGGAENLGEVANAASIAALRASQTELSRRLADLQQRYSARHPDVLRAEEERRAVDRQLGAEIGRITGSLRNEVEAATSRVRALEIELARQTRETDRSASEGEVQLREAQRRVEATRALYDIFLNRAKDLEQRGSFQEPEGRIIAPATLPGSASFPNVLLFVALPIVGGLVGGVGLAFLLAMLESTFVTGTEIERELGLPSLATLPLLSRAERRDRGRSLSILDYVEMRQTSRFAEGLRAVRIGLELSNVDRPPRIVHVTSAMPNEGKSTLASALGVSMALSGKRVLLVDCDFRHPSVSSLFELRDRKGVVDVLLGTETLESVMVPHGKTGLFVIPAGGGVKSPPDLMSSNRFQEMVQNAAGQFDQVILDSPPLLAVTDARIVAERADAVLLVVEWRSTPREIVRQALSALGQANGKLAGLVLNKVDFSKMGRYGYGYGYGYNYRHYGRYYRATSKYYAR